jgi:4-amino-4-deoxy-L-arabinose transferase-like glycosyltransferase
MHPFSFRPGVRVYLKKGRISRSYPHRSPWSLTKVDASDLIRPEEGSEFNPPVLTDALNLEKICLPLKKIPALQLILAMSLVLFLAGIWWGLPDQRGWAPDELTPSIVVDGLQQHFSNGWFGRYPPFHFYLLSLVYGPFLLLHKLRVLDLRLLSNYAILFYVGRLLSVLMGTGVVYLVYRTGREILDRRAALGAALIAALTVPLEYYAKMVNLDVPYLFWFAWSLYFFVRILKTGRLKYYLLFAATAVIAVCTKDQAYGLYVLAPLPVILFDWRQKRLSTPGLSLGRSLLDGKYLYAVLLGTGLFTLIHNLIFNLQGFRRHVTLIMGGASESYRIFPRSLTGEIKLLGLTAQQIQGSLGWPFFLLCAAGLVMVLFRKKEDPILRTLPIFALSYYMFYIAIILYNYDRFNLPICLILAFFGGRAISALWGAAGGKFRVIKALVLAIVVAYSLLYSASLDVFMIADSRYAVERWMRENIPPKAVIGLAGPGEYAPRLNANNWFYLPLSLPEFQKGRKPDYIVFASTYSRAFPDGSPEQRFFSGFATAGEKYDLVLRSKTDLPWLPVRYRNVGTNFDAINIEIQIYRRSGLIKERRP